MMPPSTFSSSSRWPGDRRSVFLVVFLSVLASASVAASSAGAVCKSPVFCGEHVEIKYPFFLSNTTEDVVLTDKNTSVPSHCGYPWLGIICEDNGKRAILRLGRDNYTVLEINHDNHTVTVADTDALDATTACPRVKHNVTLPPVLRFPIPNNDSIAFFFDCDFTGNFAEPADIAPINCSGFGRGQPSALPSFVVAEPDTPEGEWWKACKEVYVAPVMKTWLVSNLYYQRLGEDGYGQVLKRGFQLSWDPTAGDCHRCEISGSRGRCSYDNSTTFIGCLCSDGHVSTTVCGDMNHNLLFPPLLVILLLSSVPPSVSQSDAYFRYRNCAPTPYQCGSLKFEVDYPFSANGVDRPDYCSYPGYRFFCTTDSKLMIYMNSTAFQVTDFDYRNKILTVVDQNQPQETCPDRYHNTTIDESRFMFTDRDQNLTVYVNCSASLSSLPFIYDLASCLSGGKSYYKLDNSLAPEVLGSCNSTVVVPCNSTMAGLLATENSSLVDVIRGGFTVRWKAGIGWCSDCQASGGRCGVNSTFPVDDHTCYCPDGQAIGSCPSLGRSGPKISRKRTIVIGVAVVSGVNFMFLLLMCTLCGKKFYRLLFWRRGPKGTANIESFLQKHEAQHPKRYSYAEVKTMTKSFGHKLGQGGFGTVYMGKMPNDKLIAVKLLKHCKDDGQEFMNEVASISRTSHVNVVTLLGYCIQGSKRALIYEYMPNGSLERFAFRLNSGTEDSLSWEKMFDIAVGIARGLAYLHRGCNTRIVHFDIKPHNILLDQDFCPKISDFGLAKLCKQKDSIISIDGARGTIGYIAPEVFSKQFGEASSKSDVYSYGMMILEMVGARKNISASAEVSSKYFPQWIYEHLEEYCTSASEIRVDDSVLVKKMIIVGLWCIQLLPNNRPSMTRVVEMLQSCADDLQIPPQSFWS
uniref:Protein kinase domain-containing protein n=1 Tax=Leersia perrieri TaxID=77586 RepID=A0A0D9WJE5_9ORYZ